MRRGHQGIGGWRTENPRHYRPNRSGGTAKYRPNRGFSLLESPRFPPPGPRGPRTQLTLNHSKFNSNRSTENYDRNNYIGGHHNPRLQEPRGLRQRLILPYIQQSRHKNDHNNYSIPPPFFSNNDHTRPFVNIMGDVDDRQNASHNRESFPKHITNPVSPWSELPPDVKRIYDQRSSHINHRHQESTEASKAPFVYTGHRPPASDHFDGNSVAIINNNDNSFTRSVDDTVDIVRKRLLHRNDTQHVPNQQTLNNDYEDNSFKNSSYPVVQEQPKKKHTKYRPNTRTQCDKIKNKIVNQLFKMDKDKIHKLMDNPNSSTKFEYAISSLITESQNSLNRHLRSVVEKSLCNSSTEFIQNDHNNIYEDTFMKQMQGILEPQDTLFLEDIKPFVLAELSKVLQLDNIDQGNDLNELDDNGIHMSHNVPNVYRESYNVEDYEQDANYATQEQHTQNNENTDVDERNYNFHKIYELSEPLYERHSIKTKDEDELKQRQSVDINLRSVEISNRRISESIPISKQESAQPMPLFDSNAEQLSDDDEDPFAELDQQYHVAVDHNFIENEYSASPQLQKHLQTNVQTCLRETPKKNNLPLPESFNVKAEIDNDLLEIAKIPLEFSPVSVKIENINASLQDPVPSKIISNSHVNDITDSIVSQHIVHTQETFEETSSNPLVKSQNSTSLKTSTTSKSRKRSIDQKPTHRKEKRKKSVPDSNKQTNTHVVKDKNVDKIEDLKSTLLTFCTEKVDKESAKDIHKLQSENKNYSDKYVKRKENNKRPRKKNDKSIEKHTSSSSSHSILSPKETTSNNNLTPTKSETKTKLKSIDMFTEQTRKISVHQACRNTACIPSNIEKKKSKKIITQEHQKVTTKHISIQTVIKTHVKDTQTIGKRLVTRGSQTTSEVIEKPQVKSDDPLERMKQIDLEIQMLLQEKFKLYSSIEAKDTTSSTMQNLGMTVVNVTACDTSKESECQRTESPSEDSIIEDFANIPVEELAEIALASVQNPEPEIPSPGKINKRPKRQNRRYSQSPTPVKLPNRRTKTPNISLLEQIITDDRPLEDIIVLDELEVTPVKTKLRRPQKKSKVVSKKPKNKRKAVQNAYSIKPCSVVLIRHDITSFLMTPGSKDNCLPTAVDTHKEDNVSSTHIEITENISESGFVDLMEPHSKIEYIEPSDLVETVISDDQFDMLDVSEDIVIGDSCEGKIDKEGKMEVPITEEIILDNSQSSCDDMYGLDGTGENQCKMYDYSTDENLMRESIKVTGNADAVLAIECVESNFLAACLNGNIYYFSGDGHLLNTLRGSNLAVTCLTIVKEKYGTTVYTGSLDSRIRYYDLETGLEKGPECNVLSPIQTMDRAWDTIFVGTRTGFVLQFECKNNMLIPVSTVKFSEQSILALRAMKEGPRKVLLVAARSEDVTIKDAQTGLLLRTLIGPKMTVYTLLLEDGKIFCGTSSHQIHVFDYASGGHVGTHEGGKGAVCLRATGGLVFAGCYDGCVYVFRDGEAAPLAQLRGPSLMLLSLAIVGSKIIAGYKDRSLYIWKIPITILQEMIL